VMKTTAAAVSVTTTGLDRTGEPKYTREEAAKLIGVSPITVWREVKRGRLECYRLCGGRVLRIGRSHIEEYLSKNEQRGERSSLGIAE
jgi:excisionase family DNA binding protein